MKRSVLVVSCLVSGGSALLAQSPQAIGQGSGPTATPIKHLVVIFQENNSFDHYFGTYPYATNPAGEPAFYPAPDTPVVDNLTPELIAINPNSTKPFRLDRSEQVICDNDNGYQAEQLAYNSGLLNKFPQNTSATGASCMAAESMAYYDGNTLTALWNYAQHYSMSDRFFDAEFGTTVMGHLNLISGQTHTASVKSISGKISNGTVVANVGPAFDDCGSTPKVQMTSLNIGDLLNQKGVTWGWFYGDFEPVSRTSTGAAVCNAEYDGHYDPFNYYASTANPHHLPPTSVAAIGKADQANHQYSLVDLWNAMKAGNLPAVTFVKAPANMTGHPNTSTALLEQQFLVSTINQLELSPMWKDMAIILTYDDSDGWYDHVMPPIVNQSNDPSFDALTGPGTCGTAASGAYLDRCGYGTRLPFLVLSPFAKHNNVDSHTTDTTSIIRFIEDNWDLGRIGDQSFDAFAGSILGHFDFAHPRRDVLLLDPDSGEIISRF